MTRRYRVTVAKQYEGDLWVQRHSDFPRWWWAFKYARAMRSSGYRTQIERMP